PGGGAPGGGGAAGGGRGGFSPDSKWAFVTTGASKSVVDSVAKAQAAARASRGNGGGNAGAGGGGAAGQQPAVANPATKAQIVLVKLADGSKTELDGRTPRFAKDNGKWMLYAPGGDTTGADAAAAGGGRGGRGGGG